MKETLKERLTDRLFLFCVAILATKTVMLFMGGCEPSEWDAIAWKIIGVYAGGQGIAKMAKSLFLNGTKHKSKRRKNKEDK